MSNNVNAPENLRVRPSKFKSELSFNEWAEKLNVSSGYIPPTPYFTGNSKIFIEPYVILNNKPGFKEFKKSYLTVGFTNCEKSPFAQILLNLGGFQLI